MLEPTKSTRREFLSGTSAADALADAVAGEPQPLPLPKTVGAEPGSHLLSVSREAMACLFEVVFDAATGRELTEAAVAALELLEPLESQLTVYRDTSEVSRLNRRAAEEAVEVEEGLFRLLERAVALSEATLSAFDITAGRLSKVWGFYRRQGQLPAPEEIAAALATVGSRHLQLDRERRTARFTQPGLELNLGAIGKGYSLDRVADALAAGGLSDFLLHGGNSSVLARGRRIWDLGFGIWDSSKSEIRNPKSQIPAGWLVALRHPLKPDVRLAEFVLRDQALGTSGSGTQFFHHQGKRYGHILDPRSGWPAEQVLSATVIAPTAEQADALSTALYVMGLPAAGEFCRRHADISALLVTAAQRAGGIELHPLNLPADRWRRL
ncbi:MAG TPA: FAD:protein FMN transferase [Pirellulaceae bacterium]|nr:FAD:protein FMN transferase [Pirellulaceae bacterium]